MGGTGCIFVPGCSRIALGPLQLGVSLGGGLKTPGYVLRVYAVRLNAGGAVPHDDGDSFKVCIGVVSVPVELIVCWVE